MTIATLDQLVTALASPQQRFGFYKTVTPQAVSAFTSLWACPGFPGAGADPSSGVGGSIPTDATAGAMPFTNPAGAVQTYLSRFAASLGATAGMLILYDRLWHNSGLSPTSLTAQTVNSTALTRPDANGADVEAWFHVLGTLGAGSTAPTISYTDQDGNSGNTGTLMNFVTTAATHRNFQFQLASGDSGVRSIQSYTNAATLTSGTFSLILRRRIAALALPNSNYGGMLDPLSGGLPSIPNDACLELMVFNGSAVAAFAYGGLSLIQG